MEIRDKEDAERGVILNRMKDNVQDNAKQVENYHREIQIADQKYERFLKQAEENKDRMKKTVEAAHQLEVGEINRKV